MPTDSEIAQEINRQFHRAFVMLGARDRVIVERGLQILLPTNLQNRVRKIRITLSADDTYRVQGWTAKSLREAVPAPLFDHEGIYADSVPALLSRETGLYTSL